VIRILKAVFRKTLGRLEPAFSDLIFTISAKVFNSVTIECKRDDGGGAQIHGRISVLVFANYYKFGFINSEINNAHFNSSHDWNERWNRLFDFRSYSSSTQNTHVIFKAVSTTELWKILLKLLFIGDKNANFLFIMESAHKFTDRNPQILFHYRTMIRTLFNPVKYHGTESIVLHLRRGSDLTANVRFEEDGIIFARLKALRSLYPDQNIRVYSNSTFLLPYEFKEFVTVDTKSDPFQAISHMAAAEVLVIAKSSMSYVAGVVCNGMVYSPTFWHPKLPNWSSSTKLEIAI
jgi:hypothetical protein